jgi:hypothetical protein
MKYARSNIEVSRIFDTAGGKVMISRRIAKIEGWEREIEKAKRSILYEAETKFGIKKQVRHYKKEEVI